MQAERKNLRENWISHKNHYYIILYIHYTSYIVQWEFMCRVRVYVLYARIQRNVAVKPAAFRLTRWQNDLLWQPQHKRMNTASNFCENSWDSYTLSISLGHIWAYFLFIVGCIYLIQSAFKCRKSHRKFPQMILPKQKKEERTNSYAHTTS